MSLDEKEISKIFRNAKVARLDSDITTKHENTLQILDDFKNKKIDINLSRKLLPLDLYFLQSYAEVVQGSLLFHFQWSLHKNESQAEHAYPFLT